MESAGSRQGSAKSKCPKEAYLIGLNILGQSALKLKTKGHCYFQFQNCLFKPQIFVYKNIFYGNKFRGCCGLGGGGIFIFLKQFNIIEISFYCVNFYLKKEKIKQQKKFLLLNFFDKS